jgi:hypothetical protein
VAAWGGLLSVAACGVLCVSTLDAASLVEQHVLADESDGTNWPSYGRTFRDSMIQLQKTTKMPGGDDFVVRFWSVEAARLGMSVEQLSQKCSESIAAYDRLWDAAED